MAIAGKNLKYLRKLRGWTQEEFATRLGIKRSLLGAYEEERAEPRTEVLELVSDIFKVTLDDLLRTDIGDGSGGNGNYLSKRRQLKLSIPGQAVIPFVPLKAAAGYLNGYGDPEFVDELNTFTLPMLASGNFRAFEIVGDSMLPTPSGSVIVGEKVDDMDTVKSNQAYIVVSKTEGIVYKRILRNNRSRAKVTLVSDNPVYEPYQLNLEDIMELWQAQVVITKVSPQQRYDVTSLSHLVSNLQEQVSAIKKKLPNG
ncbi:XRE family transcriptional regulator [Dinghuibacter silviterrae]|uniref:Helix-turn-helix protein n=1 Tax=Dinghuibacter silviterrae TaxID=1539049 RepID=A0A4R8DT32_9BACT|nr:LexA family transcriptional regulator [Dinghuibacter silviterrae]TDX00567.1 helix-turn-helix protein [Dinghuibacter silviterrae]